MKAKPRHYREQAERSRRVANQVLDRAVKLHLLQVAEEYDKLAEEADAVAQRPGQGRVRRREHPEPEDLLDSPRGPRRGSSLGPGELVVRGDEAVAEARDVIARYLERMIAVRSQ